ncbi:MAG: hypothetical protein ACK4E4_00625 [Rhodocyclaceae bacterium]
MLEEIGRTGNPSLEPTGRNTGRRVSPSPSPLVIAAEPALRAEHDASANRIASPRRFSPILSETKGWAGKALEFINSGPPALLNNPRRSIRRVADAASLVRVICHSMQRRRSRPTETAFHAISSFLKLAMEVHYG